MPTQAEQNYQEQLMRQAIANAQIAAQKGMQGDAARAAMYQADKATEAAKYGADIGLQGITTRDTGETTRQGTFGQRAEAQKLLEGDFAGKAALEKDLLTQRGLSAAEVARIGVAPEMSAAALRERMYGDTRGDITRGVPYKVQGFIGSQFDKAITEGAAPGAAANPFVERILEKEGYGDPLAMQDRALQLRLQEKIATAAEAGNPEAQQYLKSKGFNIPAGAFVNPQASMAQRAAQAATTDVGLTNTLEPDVQALEKLVSDPNGWVSAKNRQSILNAANALINKAQAAGFDRLAIDNFKAGLRQRLGRAAERSGLIFGSLKSDLEPVINEALQ